MNKIISIDTLKYYNDKISNCVDEKVSDAVNNLETALKDKQDKLIDGTNIKTINGESILGEGNIVVNVDTSNLATKEELQNLENEVIDNEKVVAIALNDVNERLNNISNTTIDTSNLATKEELQNLENEIIDNEEVIAETFSYINERLNNISNTTIDTSNLATKEELNAKQDKISDLETIRSGAAKGETALQEHQDISHLASKEELQNLENEVNIGEKVIAAALNDLNTRLTHAGTVTGVTGVKINGEKKDPSDGIVDLGYISKQLSTSTESSMTLSPNIYYRNTSTTLSTLTITLGSVSNSDIINEYFVEFTTSSSGTTVSLPSTIKWANGEAPTFEESTTYQISIVNNLGVVTKFK